MTNKPQSNPAEAAELHRLREEILSGLMKVVRLVDQYATTVKRTDGDPTAALLQCRSELYDTTLFAAMELESEKGTREDHLALKAEQFLNSRGISNK